jgi:Carboxypeptidase regulatory-like domain
MMHRLLPLLICAGVLLSGCSSPPAEEEVPVQPGFEDLNLKPTASTGIIRGVVVDAAIRPVAGATVVLNGEAPKQATSTADGLFGFADLAPGTYFLTVTKLGYFEAQQSAEVVAGIEEPPIVKVQLAVDVENQPFTELLTWTGFFGCGVGTNGGGGIGFNPCAVDNIACEFADVCLLNTANTHEFHFGASRLPDFAQAEMVWEGTQALGNELNLGWHESGTADFKGTSGPSPLVLPATQEEILDAHDANITHLLVRVFPGSNTELTVTLQQTFDVYVTYFYGFVPREGWAFVTDGACTSPAECA